MPHCDSQSVTVLSGPIGDTFYKFTVYAAKIHNIINKFNMHISDPS